MNSSIILNVHSFVDLITNSSSETYITASDKTVTAIKNIIKLFLENANIATPVDELFDVKLVYVTEEYDEKKDKYVEKEVEGTNEYHPSRIRVTVKPGVEDFGELVKLLNKLNDAFSATEIYN